MRPNNPFSLLTEALEEIPKAEEAMAILVLHELGSDLPRELPLRSILESLARAHGNALPPIAFHVFLEKLWEFPPLMRRLAARRDAPPEALERLALPAGLHCRMHRQPLGCLEAVPAPGGGRVADLQRSQAPWLGCNLSPSAYLASLVYRLQRSQALWLGCNSRLSRLISSK